MFQMAIMFLISGASTTMLMRIIYILLMDETILNLKVSEPSVNRKIPVFAIILIIVV